MTTTLTTTARTKATTSTSTSTTTRVATAVKTKRMIQTYLMLVTLSAFSPVAKGLIEIRELNMPERVENGTRDSIILDCVYSLDEANDKYKLVVKWFFRDDPVPVYQWIPELNKRTYSPRFANKIDTNFYIPHASPLTKYRALNLVNVTTDLSGTYSCHVASLTSQDSKKKDLIVYGKFSSSFHTHLILPCTMSLQVVFTTVFQPSLRVHSGHCEGEDCDLEACHCLFSCVISSHTHCQVAPRKVFPVVLCLPWPPLSPLSRPVRAQTS